MVRDWRDELGELGLPHVPEDLLQDGEAGLDVGSHIVQLEQNCGAKGAAIRAGERRGNELVDALGGVRGREPLGEATDDEDCSLEILWGIGEQLTAVCQILATTSVNFPASSRDSHSFTTLPSASPIRPATSWATEMIGSSRPSPRATGRCAHFRHTLAVQVWRTIVYARLTLDATPAR